MEAPGTDSTITVDACIINYYLSFKSTKKSPRGLSIDDIRYISKNIIEKYPIAVNPFIRGEYESLCGPEVIKNLFNIRVREELLFPVPIGTLNRGLVKRLRIDYGFDEHSRDAKYIKTCYKTIFKRLITQNRKDFDCIPFSKRGPRMGTLLNRYFEIEIFDIKRACTRFKNAS